MQIKNELNWIGMGWSFKMTTSEIIIIKKKTPHHITTHHTIQFNSIANSIGYEINNEDDDDDRFKCLWMLN